MDLTQGAYGTELQEQSPLLRMLGGVPEIRLKIYAELFSETRLSYAWIGRSTKRRPGNNRISPARNSLAILRVCRLISNDIADNWMGQVLFSFEEPLTMLKMLFNLPANKVAKIRYIRVSGFRRDWLLRRKDTPAWYLINLVPGLHLDQLCVIECEYTPELMDWLVEESTGWRELHVFRPGIKATDSGRHCSCPLDLCRKVWPVVWNLEDRLQWRVHRRDGVSSKPSAAVYTPAGPNAYERVHKPEGYDRWTYEKLVRWHLKHGHMGIYNEISIVVRRGDGVNYNTRLDAPERGYLPTRVPEHQQSWEELRNQCKQLIANWWPHEHSRLETMHTGDELDRYGHTGDLWYTLCGWRDTPWLKCRVPDTDALMRIEGEED